MTLYYEGLNSDLEHVYNLDGARYVVNNVWTLKCVPYTTPRRSLRARANFAYF